METKMQVSFGRNNHVIVTDWEIYYLLWCMMYYQALTSLEDFILALGLTKSSNLSSMALKCWNKCEISLDYVYRYANLYACYTIWKMM